MKAPDKIADYGSNENRATIYQAIEDLYPGTENQEAKNAAIKNFAPMFGGGIERFTDEEKLQTTQNFMSKIGNKITDTSNKTSNEIQALIDDNKTYVDAYFRQTNNAPFIKQLTDDSSTKITITPDTTDTNGNMTYKIDFSTKQTP